MIRRLFLLSSLALASGADAQNTESLRGAEHAIATQIAVGGMSALFRSYGRQLGSMLAANLSVQGWTEDAVTIRGDLWALRRLERSDYYTYVGADSPPRPDGHHSTESFAIAIGLSPVFRVNLPRDISIEASLGAGVVPYALGTIRSQQSSAPTEYRESSRSAGWYVSPGLTIRWWHFVVQQHAVQLLNADRAVFDGENAPLTFGFRW